MGMDAKTVESVLSLVSGVLLLGNVRIEGESIDGLPDAAVICKDDRADFQVKLRRPHTAAAASKRSCFLCIHFTGVVLFAKH